MDTVHHEIVSTQLDSTTYSFFSKTEFSYHIWRNSTTVHHKHENYVEVFVVLRGQILNKMLNTTNILSAGDIGIVLPNVLHIHEKVNDDEVELINITCNNETAEIIFNEIYHRSMPTSSIQKLNKHEFSIVKNFNNIILNSRNISDHKVLISSLCITLFGFIKASSSTLQQGPQAFIKFVNSLPSQDLANIHINELYILSGYSQRSLATFFKKYLNQTLVQYVNDIKLNRAKNLLLTTDYSTTEICEIVGFNSISHFNHLFKHKYGISPRDYKSNSLNIKQTQHK